MIRFSQIPFLLFLLWTGFLTGQDKPEYSISLIDPALRKNAHSVIRFEETRYVIESPRNYIHQTSKAVTIFHKDSRESVVLVPYNKYSKAEIISIILYDASGRYQRRIKKSELLDIAYNDGFTVYSDQRYKGIKSFGGQLPYTLEYTWIITFDETMYYPDWHPQAWEESVEEASFILDVPSEMVIHTKTVNADFEHTQETKDGRLIRRWTISKHEALKEEESGPPEHELFPSVLLAPSAFQVEEHIGNMSDWKSFGDFFYKLNKGREKVTPEMSSLIHKMTKDCSSELEKIDTLYKWMQKNMRYVSVQLGIGGWQSFDAPYVEKNKYGDCKALSTFMKGMLQEVGIESYQAVIKWDEDESHFADDFTILDFNHMMLHIPGENMWLECTSNYLPAGIIDKYEENKKVLLLTPGGGQIVTTPSSTADTNQKYSLDSVFIDDLSIKGKKQYFGNTQRLLRYHSFNTSPEEQKKSFLENFPLSVHKLHNFQTVVDKTGKESGLEYVASVSQFGSVSGNRYFIPVNALYTPEYTCSSTERKTPYYSRDAFTETSELVVALPEGYSIEFIPTKIHLEFLGNEYLLTITVDNGFIHIHQKTIVQAFRIPAEQYTALCSYYNSVMKANSQMVILKKLKT